MSEGGLRVNSPHVIHETIDGEVIVINLASGNYYSVKGAGADVWDVIESVARCRQECHRGRDRRTLWPRERRNGARDRRLPRGAAAGRARRSNRERRRRFHVAPERGGQRIEDIRATAAREVHRHAGSRPARSGSRGGQHGVAGPEARRFSGVTATSAIVSAELGFGRLEPLLQSFDSAVEAASAIVERDFRLAGAAVRFRSPSSEMLRRLCRAFAHLELADPVPAPDLVVNLWDSASGGRRLRCRTPRDEKAPGAFFYFSNELLRAGFQLGTSGDARVLEVYRDAPTPALSVLERGRRGRGTGSPTRPGSPTGRRRRHSSISSTGGYGSATCTCSTPVQSGPPPAESSSSARVAPASPRPRSRAWIRISSLRATTTSASR